MRSRPHHRATVRLRALSATLAAALACAPADDATPVDLSTDYDGLVLTDAPNAVAPLAWHAPRADCPLAYLVRIDETFPPGLAEFLHVSEEHSLSVLVLGWGFGTTGPEDMPEGQWSERPVPKDRPFAGQLMFRGPKTSGRGMRSGSARDVNCSSTITSSRGRPSPAASTNRKYTKPARC